MQNIAITAQQISIEVHSTTELPLIWQENLQDYELAGRLVRSPEERLQNLYALQQPQNYLC